MYADRKAESHSFELRDMVVAQRSVLEWSLVLGDRFEVVHMFVIACMAEVENSLENIRHI